VSAYRANAPQSRTEARFPLNRFLQGRPGKSFDFKLGWDHIQN
jgi:hypothetical protein